MVNGHHDQADAFVMTRRFVSKSKKNWQSFLGTGMIGGWSSTNFSPIGAGPVMLNLYSPKFAKFT